MKSFVRILPLFLVFAAPASSQTLDQWVSQERFAEAAVELERLAASGEPVDEGVLRQAIESARGRLDAGDSETGNAARRVLCLARAHFPEENLPPAQDQPAEPMRVKDQVQRPQIISSVKPQYTPEAKEQRIMGVVILESIIDREGCVRDTRVLKGLPSGLGEAAVAAVRNWTFAPAIFEGKPVNVYYVVTVNFQLGDPEKKDG
jgi:TonB family protein